MIYTVEQYLRNYGLQDDAVLKEILSSEEINMDDLVHPHHEFVCDCASQANSRQSARALWWALKDMPVDSISEGAKRPFFREFLYAAADNAAQVVERCWNAHGKTIPRHTFKVAQSVMAEYMERTMFLCEQPYLLVFACRRHPELKADLMVAHKNGPGMSADERTMERHRLYGKAAEMLDEASLAQYMQTLHHVLWNGTGKAGDGKD